MKCKSWSISYSKGGDLTLCSITRPSASECDVARLSSSLTSHATTRICIRTRNSNSSKKKSRKPARGRGKGRGENQTRRGTDGALHRFETKKGGQEGSRKTKEEEEESHSGKGLGSCDKCARTLSKGRAGRRLRRAGSVMADERGALQSAFADGGVGKVLKVGKGS